MRSLGFILLWLAGSAAAVTVAFAGVAVVDDGLINPPPAQVSERWTEEPALTSVTATPVPALATTPLATIEADVEPATAIPVASADSSPTSIPSIPVPPSAVTPTALPTPLPPTAPPTSEPVISEALSPTPVPSTPVPSTPVPSTPVRPTAIAEPAAQVVTYNLVGGTTAVAFSASGVQVLWATPNPGFSVEIDGGSQIRVEFESDGHRSRLDAWWADGPAHEIDEDD